MSFLRLLAKSALTADEAARVELVLHRSEHQSDWSYVAMPGSWERFDSKRLFAFFDQDEPIGIVAINGAPESIDPAWWIIPSRRDQKLGSRMIEALAAHLIAHGVTGVGRVVISSAQDAQSRRLVDKLRALVEAA